MTATAVSLRRRSIELDDDTSRLLLDERLLGYIAATQASEKPILTRPTSDDADKELPPSPFWSRFDQLFSGARPSPPRATHTTAPSASRRRGSSSPA